MVNLQKIRTDFGLTQEELAKRCGVVRQTIGEIERGQNKPSVELAKKLGQILNVDWTEFFSD